MAAALKPLRGFCTRFDLVVRRQDDDYGLPNVTGILELKNRAAYPPDKNDVIVFFAKIVDYLTSNPSLLHMEVVPVFLSATTLEESALQACLGLGIHPVAPSLRPLPVVIDSGQRIYKFLSDHGFPPPFRLQEFEDFAARVNRVALALEPVDFGRRFGFMSETTISIKAVDGKAAADCANELRALNSECLRFLRLWKEQRVASGLA